MRRTEPNEIYLTAVCSRSRRRVVGVQRFQSCSVWLPLCRLPGTFSSLLISPRQTNQNTSKHRLQSSPQPRRLHFIARLCRDTATAAFLCPSRSESANGMQGTKDAQRPMLTAVSPSLCFSAARKKKTQGCAWRTNQLKKIQDKLMLFDPLQGNDFMIALHKAAFGSATAVWIMP